MHDAGQHLLVFVFSIAFSALGWFMAHNPVRAYRAFTLGVGGTQLGQKFFVGFCKIVGWCFAAVFAVAAIIQLVLGFLSLLR